MNTLYQRCARGGLTALTLALFFTLFAPDTSRAQTTHTVCASDCDFTSIQAAVTAANPGDTILVGDGTYVENVIIEKNLTLRSVNGRAVTTIKGVTGAGSLGTIRVTGNTSGVTIGGAGQGFTIVGIDNGDPGIENAAIYFQGAHSGASILDNEIQANGEHGLLNEYGEAISGFVIDGNTFSGQSFLGDEPRECDFGGQFTNANVPRQMVVMGNGGGDVATAKATDIQFTNNVITGVAGGATSDPCPSGEQGNTLVTLDVANSTITGNTFSGTTASFASALRVRRPGTTISGNTFISDGMGLGTAHMFLQNNTTPIEDVADANTFDKGSYSEGGSYVSVGVAAGVSRAAAGSTLHVLGGEYATPRIVFASDISIVGDPNDKPVLKPTQSFSATNQANAWFLVESGVTFDLSNVVIDGDSYLLTQALRSHGTTTVDNVDFRRIWRSAEGSPYLGVAIGSYGGTVPGGSGSDSHSGGGPAAALTVTNSTFDDIGRIGILIKGTESTATISDNMFTGKGTGNFLDYAVEVGAGGSATITGNTISGNRGVAASDGSNSAGILVTDYYGTGTSAVINENTFTDNTSGIAVGYADGDASDVIAHGNSFTSNDYGIRSKPGTPVDASLNWWGDADPSDDVVGSVDYSPWPGAAPGTSPMTWYTNDSIGDAVAAAEAGDTIEVLAGTYDETVVLNKKLTLNGPNAGTAGTASRAAEAIVTAFQLNAGAAGSTIDGFTFQNGATILSQLTGLYVAADDVEVKNNRFMRSGDVDADVSRGLLTAMPQASGLVYSGNYANGWHTGIYLNPGAANAAISNSTFENNFVGMSTDNPIGVAVSEVVVKNNLLEGIGVGAAASCGLSITGSSFTGNPDALAVYGSGCSGTPVAAENNWWGTSNPADVIEGAAGVDYDPWVGKPAASPENPVTVSPNTPLSMSETDGTKMTFSKAPVSVGGEAPKITKFEVRTFEEADVQDQVSEHLAGVTDVGLVLKIESNMVNYSFETTIELDVSAYPGFNENTKVAYWNSTTQTYVVIGGTYAVGPPATFTFTTNHFTEFVFFNTEEDPYFVYVSSADDAVSNVIYPNTDWTVTAYDPNDWLSSGAEVVFYLLPGVDSQFGSVNVTVQWDASVLGYVEAVKDGGLYDGVQEATFIHQLGSPNSVTINAARMDNTNFNITDLSGGDQYIAKLTFNLLRPGHSAVDITALNLRAFNGLGGQLDIYSESEGAMIKSYLGDVATNGSEAEGDGVIDLEDLLVWRDGYWSGVPGFSGGLTNYQRKLDVGPTDDNTVFGMPEVDTRIDFEDLMIFAMSYGLSAADAYPEATPQEPTGPVALAAGDVRVDGGDILVPIEIGNVSRLRGGSFRLLFDASAFELVGAEKGALIPSDRAAFASAIVSDGAILADLAVVGGTGLEGAGELLVVRLRPTADLASAYEGREDLLGMAEVSLRDVANSAIEVSFRKATSNEGGAGLPEVFALHNAYPNPFTPQTTLGYDLPKAGAVRIEVMDVMGRLVQVLVDEEQAAGRYSATWNAQSLNGTAAASGVYFVRMQAGEFMQTQKVVLVK